MIIIDILNAFLVLIIIVLREGCCWCILLDFIPCTDITRVESCKNLETKILGKLLRGKFGLFKAVTIHRCISRDIREQVVVKSSTFQNNNTS